MFRTDVRVCDYPEKAALDGATSSGTPGQRLAHWALSLAWIINVALLIAAFAWTYFDGRALHAMDALRGQFGFRPQHLDSIAAASGRSKLSVQTAMVFGAVLGGSFAAMFIGLVIGRRRFRTTRAWLLFMTLACGWLGFIACWPEVYWKGQQRRVAADLVAAESLAKYLHSNWPSEDGNLDGVGPFLAYPQGDPTTVLPLKATNFPNTVLGFSAVERSTDGVIRFELTGDEAGAWLEWRADDRPPRAFKNGLEMYYNVSRHQRLATHWYLVRYRQVVLGHGAY